MTTQEQKSEGGFAAGAETSREVTPPVLAQDTAEAVKKSLKSALDKTIREVVSETRQGLRSAIDQTISEAVEAATMQEQAQTNLGDDRADMIYPHAFVVMPFGKKKGFDGQMLDFNAIYQQLIKPALEDAGFVSFRADEETVSGDILTDMFQELLLADLVICDMSIDNANVFYELGIRHAFRKRGVVHIQSGRAYMPFDIFNVRTIPYHTTPEGVPDPAFLEKDRQAIARVTRDTWASDIDAIHSPVFNLLSGLEEPNRKSLRTPLATGFWREYNEWKQRVTVAQRQKRIGDILVLTEEITTPLIKEEAVGEAGQALQNMGRYELALQEYRQGLEINPRNLRFRREEALHLNRLGRVDEAIVKLENLLSDVPHDSEAIGYLGRIYKDMWFESWKWIEDKEKGLHEAFASYHWLIKSIRTYLAGYHHNLNNTYPGVNALTLATILTHLADRFEDHADPDPDINEIREVLPKLRDTLLFALETLAQDEKSDYWTLVSLADLQVLTAENPGKVVRAYRKAFTAARKNLFFLNSTRNQLEILRTIGLREAFVQAGLATIDAEIHRISKKEAQEADKESPARKSEGQVFLFSGYPVDLENQKFKRFPIDQEEEVKTKLGKTLEKFNACAEDIAFLPGLGCGSEILFAELCTEKGIAVEINLPLPEAAYINKFVAPGGNPWIERFYRLRNHPLVHLCLQSDHIGKPKPSHNIHTRNNRWTLYSSLVRGIDKVHLIALWDGKTEPPPDLAGNLVLHMVEQMRQFGGQIEHIDSTQFLPLPTAEQSLQALVDMVNVTARKRR